MPRPIVNQRHVVIGALLVIALAACAPSAPPATEAVLTSSSPAAPTSYTDPFAYCAAVGTIDQPDARYTGTPVPDAVINGFKQAANLQSSSEPMDTLRKTTIWRCMDGKVYACNFGANLACDSKADTSETSTAPLDEYCAANPNADFIPLAVVGHNSIYSWHCVNGTAKVLNQVDSPDAQGYLKSIWYALTPAP